MSLSDVCLNQYAREDAITQKWLVRGLWIAVGAHLGLFALISLIPPTKIDPPERIALVVTGPAEPVEVIEEAPPVEAQLSTETQVSGGGQAPPPPLSAFQPTPPAASEPEPPQAKAPVEDAAELVTPETEVNEDIQETPEPEVADTNNSDLSALRDRLNRNRPTESAESGSANGSANTGEASGTGTDISRRTGPGEGTGTGTGTGTGSGDGEGAGNSSGPTTVSCRRCDRPEYPEEALDAGVEGSPSVSLQYDENGNVIGAVLERSSGNAALDQAALEAARNYELNSGGRSGSVSVEIDFGIEGSARSRAAQERGERDSVTTPAPEAPPEREIVREPVPPASESPAPEPPASEPPASEPPASETETVPPVIDNRPEEIIGVPLPADVEGPPATNDSPTPEVPETPSSPVSEPAAPEPAAPEPEPAASESAPPSPSPVPDISPTAPPAPAAESPAIESPAPPPAEPVAPPAPTPAASPEPPAPERAPIPEIAPPPSSP